MPITDDGFVNYDFADILAETKALFQDERAFGQQADVSDGSPWGRLAYVLATRAQEGDGRLEDGYDASSSNYATGVSLDRQCTIAGIQRRNAQYAEATLKITGQAGYLIEEQTYFNTDNGTNFISREDVQIGDDGTATVVADSELPEEAANVDAHTIINQVNPVDEIDKVDNAEAATGGADLEDDYTLRNRLTQNKWQKANSTLHGMETALLNTNGVFSVTPQENQTDTVNADGLPPHTMRFYVAGGKDEDIFNTLATYKGAGATIVGDKSTTVQYGNSVSYVAFSRSEVQYIKFKLNLVETDGFDLDAVNETIGEFIDDLQMGSNIIINKLYGSLYNLSGISQINDIQVSIDGGQTFTSNNVKLSNYQLARVTDQDIEVINDAVH